jgi:hypothetical protein
MEACNDEETRAGEALRVLRSGNAAKELSRAIGRYVDICEAAVLLSVLCEHKNRPDQARVFVACAKALESEVRSMRAPSQATSTPRRSEQQKQYAGKHPDSMQALSRLLAHFGEEAWKNGSWENAVHRIARNVAARVDRLKAIGNGQVPAVAAIAWQILCRNTSFDL